MSPHVCQSPPPPPLPGRNLEALTVLSPKQPLFTSVSHTLGTVQGAPFVWAEDEQAVALQLRNKGRLRASSHRLSSRLLGGFPGVYVVVLLRHGLWHTFIFSQDVSMVSASRSSLHLSRVRLYSALWRPALALSDGSIPTRAFRVALVSCCLVRCRVLSLHDKVFFFSVYCARATRGCTPALALSFVHTTAPYGATAVREWGISFLTANRR